MREKKGREAIFKLFGSWRMMWTDFGHVGFSSSFTIMCKLSGVVKKIRIKLKSQYRLVCWHKHLIKEHFLSELLLQIDLPTWKISPKNIFCLNYCIKVLKFSGFDITKVLNLSQIWFLFWSQGGWIEFEKKDVNWTFKSFSIWYSVLVIQLWLQDVVCVIG